MGSTLADALSATPELTFELQPEQVAPLFAGIPANVTVPASFVQYL